MIASTPDGSSGEILLTSSSSVTSSAPWMRIVETLPGVPKSFCASSKVNAAKVSPVDESSTPNEAIPTIVTGMACGTSTVVLSPTLRFPTVAAPSLMTISPAAAGATPLVIRAVVSSGSSIQLWANVGGPCPPIGLPSLPTIWPAPSIVGTATSTPSTLATSPTTDSGTGARCSPAAVATDVDPWTTTLMPALAWANAVLNEARMVSPSRRVPAKKATPKMIADDVPMRRRLCDAIERKTIRSTFSSLQILGAIDDGLDRRIVDLIHDGTVLEEQDRIRVARC